jgi:excisionase family DNA binding protein
MKDPNDRLLVTMTVSELEQLTIKAVKTALANAPPPKVQYTLDEAAALLTVTPTWLAEKCRAGEVEHHRLAHHYRFTREDIDNFLASTERPKRVKKNLLNKPENEEE